MLFTLPIVGQTVIARVTGSLIMDRIHVDKYRKKTCMRTYIFTVQDTYVYQFRIYPRRRDILWKYTFSCISSLHPHVMYILDCYIRAVVMYNVSLNSNICRGTVLDTVIKIHIDRFIYTKLHKINKIEIPFHVDDRLF